MLKPLPRLFLCSMDVEYDISLNCYDFLLILPILGLAYLFMIEDNLKIHLTKPTSSFPINHPIEYRSITERTYLFRKDTDGVYAPKRF